MTTIDTDGRPSSPSFHVVAESFLDQPGLAFAEVLGAQDIEAAFIEHDALFGADDIYSTPLVTWAFLAQSLRDGKGAACAAAVADIAVYQQQTGRAVPCGDTGDYTRARAKLHPAALHQLIVQAAEQLEQQADPSWLWHGRHAKLVDGFTFTLPDTPANQRAFPQQKNQRPGAGLPIARAVAVLSLATGAVCDLAFGPYQGKETGETALLRQMLDALHPGDLAVFDRYYCSFLMLALLQTRGVHFCTTLHQRRPADFRRGRRLGHDDRLVTWTRPQRPDWMSEQVYQRIPRTLTLRQVRFQISQPGQPIRTMVVVTSLTDPIAWPKEAIAELFGFRWNAELDIRAIKQTLHLDHLRCKSPAMIRRELYVTLLAYNLIRKLIATAAAVHGRQPRQIGFTGTCQAVLASWMLLATGHCRDPRQLWQDTLARIAANVVADRPGRIEPRMLKRRKDRYPYMHEPRSKLRHKALKT
jgi:putative transposase